MKKLVQSLVLVGLLSGSGLVMAEDSPHSVTGNIGLYSDYAFRGQSQTAGDAAIQGGFDYAHSSGFYAGTWASNVETAFLNGANIEIDVYGGYSGSAGDLGYNVGLLKYYYPGQTASPNIDTLEAYAGVTYKGAGLKMSYNLDDYFGVGNSDGTVYWDASYGTEVGAGVTLSLHYGYTAGQGTVTDYADWKIGVSKEIAGLTVGLAYTDTDLPVALVKGEDVNDGRFILSVSKTF